MYKERYNLTFQNKTLPALWSECSWRPLLCGQLTMLSSVPHCWSMTSHCTIPFHYYAPLHYHAGYSDSIQTASLLLVGRRGDSSCPDRREGWRRARQRAEGLWSNIMSSIHILLFFRNNGWRNGCGDFQSHVHIRSDWWLGTRQYIPITLWGNM